MKNSNIRNIKKNMLSFQKLILQLFFFVKLFNVIKICLHVYTIIQSDELDFLKLSVN